MMKKYSVMLAFIGICSFFSITAQTNVGIGTSNPKSSAILDVESTTQGFLPPRMTEDQRDAIATPVAGLVVWCNNCGTDGELQVHNGTAWTNMVGDPVAVYTPEIGDAYRGGIVAYIFQSGDPGYVANETHGLIASSSDLSTGIIHSTVYGAPLGLPQNLGAGYANTTTFITVNGNPLGSNYAANLCRNYNGGGYTDWSLPSIDELLKFYNNRVAIGGFSTDSYWASRYFDGGTGYLGGSVDFATGNNWGRPYNQSAWDASVRAVRYF